MAIGGAVLKLLQTFLYAVEFFCAAIILGIYSYFLSILADRNLTIFNWVKAVEGISGAAVLYTIFAVLLTFCLGGKAFFALIAIILDLLFCGGFIALAVLTRDGAHSCSGDVATPLGNGSSKSKQGFHSTNQGDQITYAVSLGTACRLNTACFAVAVLGALLFAVSTLVQVALARHHKKEKRFGPSPANNYTRGTGAKFWQRRRKNRSGVRDPEMAGGVPATGSTVAPHSATYDNPHKPLVGGYHTAPTGTYNHATSATNY